jgi:hypothetical protein
MKGARSLSDSPRDSFGRRGHPGECASGAISLLTADSATQQLSC